MTDSEHQPMPDPPPTATEKPDQHPVSDPPEDQEDAPTSPGVG